MSTLSVITPSFGPDFDLCAALHASVLAHSPQSVRHHIIVPQRDLALFRRLAGPRAQIHVETDFLPRSFRSLPLLNVSVNLRRPFPPLRGWILQQIIKLAAAARSDADVVVVVDSDIEFIRPFTADTFRRDGAVSFYRRPGAVDERLPRHLTWHRRGRSLLGLPPGTPPFPDYISSLMAWDPVIVRALLDRVEATTGRRWADAIGAELHFSEWTLYGLFVDEILGPPPGSRTTDDALCHTYWDEIPLDHRSLAKFLAETGPDDIAVMISAKSRTPIGVRREGFARFAAHRG
ncbi:MAG TPA: DUF6492 family protein [Actinoplanes sp.]|nr:DUF6492 family protein [Actinoplanes sp.]